MVAGVVRFARLGPSLVLLAIAGTVAGAVAHLLPAEAGLRINSSAALPHDTRTGQLEYPRKAIDADGYSVTIRHAPRRIVSQYWSIDEYVYSVVSPERVIAVSESAYLPSVSNVYAQVQKYKPAISTDPERVLRLDPDLVLVSNASRPDFCALVRASQIPIFRVQTTFTSLEQVADTIRLTGYLTGEDAAAEREVRRFFTKIADAKARRKPGLSAPRILGISGKASYGSGTLFDDVVRALGGVNVGSEGGLTGYNTISSEQIIRWNPEWIVAGADPAKIQQVRASLSTDAAIATTEAARAGHIVVLDFHVFLPMSPFITLLVDAIAKAIYE